MPTRRGWDREAALTLHLRENFPRPIPAAGVQWAKELLEGAAERTGTEWAECVRVPDEVVAARVKLRGTVPGLREGTFVIRIGDVFAAMGLWPYIEGDDK